MKANKIGNYWIGKLRGISVNTGIKICIDCGSAKIAITEESVRCKSCGTTHKRKEIHGLKFQPGILVKIADSEKTNDTIYKIEKVRQDSDGRLSYILKSKSSPITLFYTENAESHLEKIESE